MNYDIAVEFSNPIPPYPNRGNELDKYDWNLILLIDGKFADLSCGWGLPLPSDYQWRVDEISSNWKRFGVYMGGLDKNRMSFIGSPLCGVVRE